MRLRLSAAGWAAVALAAGACSSKNDQMEGPLDMDYATIRIAESREGGLRYAARDADVLQPLRNGVRLMLRGDPQPAATVAGLTTPHGDGSPAWSGTTVQVEGVDEGDLVKYDGRRIYILRTAPAPTFAPGPHETRNILKVVATNPASAHMEVLSEFELEGAQSSPPQLYQVQNAQGAAEFLAVVSQNYQAWLTGQPQLSTLVVQPDRTTVQLLDVRDPRNVSQAWKIELDGWLRASRKIGSMLYLVHSYRPRLPGLALPADTVAAREANERRIRDATIRELMPTYRVNGGARLSLTAADDCVIASDLDAHEAYSDLLVITAIDIESRRITDANCLSTNVNGVYVSRSSIYVGGEGSSSANGEVHLYTVIHKFALENGEVSYRASGAAAGRIGWTNASYFMDERSNDLRIVTTQPTISGTDIHQLRILRETDDQRLALVSILPNPERKAPLGKPGEQIHAVRYDAERAYVVTARVTDPLYVIDLRNAQDPYIAGALEIPGVATYLQPLGASGSELLLSVGRELGSGGVPEGVKVELFDVSDLARPRSVGVHTFGRAGTWSDAIADPHALTLAMREGGGARVALPIDVFDTPHPTEPQRYRWSYSGQHLLEISGQAPELKFHGVVKTNEPDGGSSWPGSVTPNRSVIHDHSVFIVYGDSLIGSLWGAAGATEVRM
jgi:uncharacterized secreted protein with C-terminal beta-propeller domain